MERLPFDPSRISPGGDDGPDRPARRERRTYGHVGEAQPLTVSDLAVLIKTTLEQRVPAPLRVVGQISNLSRPGHWYFTLKDDAAVVGCVAWASSAAKFGFVPRDGDEVIATGHVSHYAPQGRTQLYVRGLVPLGEGALEARFRAMCAELRDLGYFEESRKKPLPLLPRRLAVITSGTGAAIHDVISTAAQRCRAVGLLVVDVRVQGEGAAEEVARAIRWVDSSHERLGVDAILVTRGGGSIEDLWAFNERVVADAAFSCGIPLVAAIGHESDTTVIELVADRRAATPTQAAMALMPSTEALLQQVEHHEHRLAVLVRRRVEGAGQVVDRLARDLGRGLEVRAGKARIRLERLAARLARLGMPALLARRRERLAVLADRLGRAARARADQRPRLLDLERRLERGIRHRLDAADRRHRALTRQLGAVDPRLVLRRGFSYTTNRAGEVVRSVEGVRDGEEILTHVADGSIRSVVRGGRRRRRGGGDGEQADQMDLFGSGG